MHQRHRSHGTKRPARGGRPSRQRCLAIEPLERRDLLATLPAGFVETPVATGIAAATAMELAPNGDVWVLEQGGGVKRFAKGNAAADIVGNLQGLGLSSIGERGVLGIAFDPAYATSKQVFLYYTATAPALHNRVARFTVNDSNAADYYFVGASSGGGDAGSAGTPTQTVILDLDPLSGASNHNGGAIHFGRDGKLYVAVGDNANAAFAQSLSTLHGKLLRINSDGTIPDDNPFFASTSGNNRAIWALGLRNPFTFAFQPGTGQMFVNDVGQNTWEEINAGVAGANYGWPSVEGNQGTPPAGPGTYRGPVYAYRHGGGMFEGFAITGGAFYNPTTAQFPATYSGDYFFADYSSDWINVLDPVSGSVARFASSAAAPVDLCVAADGSLYYLARNAGAVFQVTFVSAVNRPPTLSDLPNLSLMVGEMGSVPFTVDDPDTAADLLTVNVSSDNDGLFPPGSVSIAGAGGNRSVEIQPAANQTGTARLTVTVSDGSLTATDTLTVSVWGGVHPWHSTTSPEDVDGDGSVSAGDALLVINLINAAGSGALPRPTQEPAAPPFYDVSADEQLAPVDALIVINYINARRTVGSSEAAAGEFAATADLAADPLTDDGWLLAIEKAPRHRAKSASRFGANLGIGGAISSPPK